MEIDLNNMIFRVEDLTMERVMAEHGISEESRRQFPDLYKQFVEDFIPTREDLERKIDEDGLKELCLRLPCRVLMHRWNPVHDFVAQFTREGRIQRWSMQKTHKLLAKAVHRYKDICLYDEKDIRVQREREWCETKKENLMRLAVWEYDKKQQQQDANEQSAGEEEGEQLESNSCPMHVNDENNIDNNAKNIANNEQSAGEEGEEQLESNSCPMHVNDENNIDNNAKNIANYKTADPRKDTNNEQSAGEEEEEQLESNSCPMHVNDENNIDNNAKNIANYKTADPRKDTNNNHDNDVADDDELHSSASDDMETLVVNEEIIQEEDFPTQVEGVEEIIVSSVVNVESLMAELHDSPILMQSSDTLTLMAELHASPILIQSSDTLSMQPLSQSTTMNSIDLNKNALITISPTVPNSQPTTQNTENLAGQEYQELMQQSSYGSEPHLVDYINVNTESMQLDQSTTSQEIFSDECTPQYCDFNTHVSMTSTQSPTAK